MWEKEEGHTCVVTHVQEWLVALRRSPAARHQQLALPVQLREDVGAQRCSPAQRGPWVGVHILVVPVWGEVCLESCITSFINSFIITMCELGYTA